MEKMSDLRRFLTDLGDQLVKNSAACAGSIEKYFYIRPVELVYHFILTVGGIENDYNSSDLVQSKHALCKRRRILAPDADMCAFLNAIQTHKTRRQKIRHFIQFRPCAAPVSEFNCRLLSYLCRCLFEAAADCLLNQFHRSLLR